MTLVARVVNLEENISEVNMNNRVIKVETDRFTIDSDGQVIECVARKKVKRSSDILVGDIVDLETIDGVTTVKRVQKRKNSLIRPAISNVDAVVMTVAKIPEPDFYLIDKMIINCARQNISCIICVNKTDIDDKLFDEIKFQFSSDATVVATSALNGDVSDLRKVIDGKFICFAGQSAVGKSALINALCGKQVAISGDLSAINRGKNTTTRATIFPLGNHTYIADTPGFGLLEIFDVEYDELDLYYAKYVELSACCKYHRCMHVNEPSCEVKSQVEQGLLSKARYERYVQTFIELKSKKKY